MLLARLSLRLSLRSARPVPVDVLLCPETTSARRLSPYAVALRHQEGLFPPVIGFRLVNAPISVSRTVFCSMATSSAFD